MKNSEHPKITIPKEYFPWTDFDYHKIPMLISSFNKCIENKHWKHCNIQRKREREERDKNYVYVSIKTSDYFTCFRK